MRGRLLALPVSMLAGFASAHVAAGDLVATTVPTVTLTTPSLTVPTLTVPTLTVPTQTLPGLTVDTTPVVGAPGTSGSTGSIGAREDEAETARREDEAETARRASKRPRLTNFRARPWRFKNDPRAGDEMGTTLIFRLSRAATVTFSVRQEAPACHLWGRFRAAGTAGRNRVPWEGRLKGEQLPPGTYRISARARAGERRSAVRHETVVIVPLHESREDARAARSRCEDGRSSSGGLAAVARFERIESEPSPARAGARSGGDGAALDAGEGERQAAPFTGPPLPPLAGSGEAPAPWAAPAGTPAWLVPFLYTALGLALLLLGLAAVPAGVLGRDGAAVLDARRRTSLALAGASMLAGLAAAWFLL